MSLGRMAAGFRNHILRRALPHGIISWRYLLPRPSQKVRIHRTLWLRGRHPDLQIPFFLIVEFLLWMRWVLFSCWRSSIRAVAHRGRAVAEQEGIGRVTQLGHLLRLGLCHCIPPGEAYAFRLYHREARRNFWDYVFIHEVKAFHRWRGARSGETPASLAMLQDKFRLAEFLGARGVPMATALGTAPRGGVFDPTPYLQTRSRIFCKPNRGSAGRDAFVIERRGVDIDIFAAKNGVMTKRFSLDCLKRAMARDDFLIQPFLENNPDFAGLCTTEDVVTLRVITEIHPARGMECYCATLEIPNLSDGALKGHIMLPIEVSSGRIASFPGRLPPEIQLNYDAVFDRIGNQTVPFWDSIMESAFRAHRCFPDIYAVAWDYVVTPAGPVMLEGNTGWGATTPQTMYRGLLRDETGTG